MSTKMATEIKLVAAGVIRNGKVEKFETDPDFAPAITFINVPADQEPPIMTAWNLGKLDAEDNELCLPELYYVKPVDKYNYAAGYAHVKPGDLLAEQILSRFEDEMFEDAALEREAMDDEYHAWQF